MRKEKTPSFEERNIHSPKSVSPSVHALPCIRIYVCFCFPSDSIDKIPTAPIIPEPSFFPEMIDPHTSLANIWTASMHCDYAIVGQDGSSVTVEENLSTQRVINGLTFVALSDQETEFSEGGSGAPWKSPDPDPDVFYQQNDAEKIHQLELISICALETVPRYYFSGRSYRLYVSHGYPETIDWLTGVFENGPGDGLDTTTSAILVRTLTRQRERERNKETNQNVDCSQYSSKPPRPPLLNQTSEQRDPFGERKRSRQPKPPLRHFVIYGVQLPVVDLSVEPVVGLYAAEFLDPQRFVDVLGMSLDSQIAYMASFHEVDRHADVIEGNAEAGNVLSNVNKQLSKKVQNATEENGHNNIIRQSTPSDIPTDERKEENASKGVENDACPELLALRHLDAHHRHIKTKRGNLLRRSISDAHGRNKESRASKTERIPKLKRSETDGAARNRSTTTAFERETASDASAEGERGIVEEKEKETNASMSMTTMGGRRLSHHLSSRSVLSGDANMNAMTSIASAVKTARLAVQAKRRAKLEKQLSACKGALRESTGKINHKSNSASVPLSTSGDRPIREPKTDPSYDTKRRRADMVTEKQKRKKESSENDENEEREDLHMDFAHEEEENPKVEVESKNAPIPVTDEVSVNSAIEEYNKKALKKLALAALKSAGIDRNHADFAEIWQQVYKSSRFTLRKDISLRHFTPDEMERVVNRHRDWVVSGPRSFA